MYILFYLIFILIAIIMSIKIEKTIITSLFICVIGFCLFPILADLCVYKLYLFNKLSIKVHYFNLIAVVSFFVGYLFIMMNKNYFIKKKRSNKECSQFVRDKLIIGINISSWILIFPYLIKSMRLINEKGWSYSRDYVTSGLLFESTILEIIYIWIIFPVFIVTALYACLEILRKSEKGKILLFVSIISLTIHTIIFSARALIIKYLAYFMLCYILYGKSKKVKIRGKALIMVIFLLISATFITAQRSAGKSIYENVLIYYVCPFHLLNYYIENPMFSNLYDYQYGKVMFGFIYNIYEAIKYVLFGIPYNGSDKLITQITAISIPLGYGIRMNAGSTAIYPLFRDFGVISIILGFFLTAIVTGYYRNKAMDERDLRSRAIYIYLLYIVFRYSSSYLDVYSPEFLFCVIYIFFFVGINKHDKNIVKN